MDSSSGCILSSPFIIRVPLFRIFSFNKGTLKMQRTKRYYLGTGLLSNQGEKSKTLYFIMVPLRKKH